MKQVFAFLASMLLLTGLRAQDFITRGKIEFEVKRNNKRAFSASNRNDMYTQSMPEFDISYRDLTFSYNQLLYRPGRRSSSTSSIWGTNNNSVYTDLDKQRLVAKKSFIDDSFVFEDSIPKVRWKLDNETRKIAGWECRKAVGRIYDSVYVVAFYCPEIIPQGGPELFSGLPGMILGLAIPRYYTTWFATRIEIANIDETGIVPPSGKKNKLYGKKELAELLFKKYKEAGWWKEATLEKVMNMISNYTL